MKIKFRRDISTAEASFEAAFDGKIIDVRISQTARASGPHSPEYRIREKLREQILNGTTYTDGEVVFFGHEMDPRYF